MNKTELALALDITTRQLRSLASRGMPTDSLKAARLWRSTYLDITQMKEHRIDGNPGKTRRTGRKTETKKAEAEVSSKAEIELLPDPFDPFLPNLFIDTRVEIVSGLMAGIGLSFEDASLAFNVMSCCIADVRATEGFETELWYVPNPRDQLTPESWRFQIKAEIEKRARELELLAEQEI